MLSQMYAIFCLPLLQFVCRRYVVHARNEPILPIPHTYVLIHSSALDSNVELAYTTVVGTRSTCIVRYLNIVTPDLCLLRTNSNHSLTGDLVGIRSNEKVRCAVLRSPSWMMKMTAPACTIAMELSMLFSSSSMVFSSRIFSSSG